MNKFSIGPWKTARSHSHEYIRYVRDAQGEHIAHVLDLDDALAECTANARLIAAAPALYSALAELHLAVTMRPSGNGGLSQRERAALDSARAAIARATGDQTTLA
jgi:hypothetical protein